MSENVKRTNSGVKKKGEWEEIADFAEEIEEVLESTADEDSVEELRSWRPKHGEDEEDMKRKTVQVATLEENSMERKSEGFSVEMKDASKKVVKAGRKASEREAPREEISEASRGLMRPWIASVTKLFRKMESIVYGKFALRSDRYYLDTDDLSVDLRTTRDGMYQMDVNVNTRESRQELKENFKDE